MQHIITVEGRSLIRTFLASATQNAAICLVSGEQAQGKKACKKKAIWED